jgi:hypothetical protein
LNLSEKTWLLVLPTKVSILIFLLSEVSLIVDTGTMIFDTARNVFRFCDLWF